MAASKYGYTRKEMEDIIDAGGSVMHGQRIITDKAQLPSHAELASGDPAAEAQTKEQIARQIADLEAQRDSLDDAAKEREKQAKAQEEAQAKADAEAKKAEK